MWISFKYFRHFPPRFLWTVAIVLLFVGTNATPAHAQKHKPLRLASTSWSPFSNTNGKARFALDLVHEALDRAGFTEESTIVEDGKLTPLLRKGDYDGSAAIWKDDEREKTLIFSVPYLENRLILVGKQGSDVSATTFASLKGQRVALVKTYAYGDEILKSSGLINVPSASDEESLHKVLDGEAAYTLMDELVVEYLLKNYPNEARTRLAFGSTPLLVRSLHFALRRNVRDASEIIDRFNGQLLTLIVDGTYNRLLQLDWIQADIDGDGQPEYVPRADKAGTAPPEYGYALVTSPASTKDSSGSKHFYVGGKVYQNWTSVPDQFKLAGPNDTVSGGTKFSIFSFKF